MVRAVETGVGRRAVLSSRGMSGTRLSMRLVGYQGLILDFGGVTTTDFAEIERLIGMA